MFFPDGQGLDAIEGREHAVAEADERPAGQGVQGLVILDEQNGFAAAGQGGELGIRGFLGGHFFQTRKINAERRAAPDLAIHIDPTLMLLDDAEHGRQSQPGAFADILGGKKGSKIIGRISAGMPEPVSLTLKRT